jgi:hypothetical protein
MTKTQAPILWLASLTQNTITGSKYACPCLSQGLISYWYKGHSLHPVALWYKDSK